MGKNQNSALIFLIVLLFIVEIAMAGYILWDKLGDTKSEINSDNIEVNNVNVFKLSSMRCLNSDSKFRLSGFERYYSGLSVLFENDRFYLELYPDSDLAKVYPEAKSGVKVEIKGLDTTNVADVFISHVGSDLRMPQVLFLMEDGTVYSLDCRQALTTGDSKAQKLGQITGVVTMKYAYMDNTQSQVVLGFKTNGDYYLLNN